MAAGHPFYLSYVPESIYPYDNQVPALVNQHPITVPPAIVPDHINVGARPDQGPFTSAGVEVHYPSRDLRLYNQARGFYPLANTWLYFAPQQPVRRDYYINQATQPRSPGQQKSGQAPNQGIYTGTGTSVDYQEYYSSISGDYGYGE